MKIENLNVSHQDMSSSSGSEIEEIQMHIDANQNLASLNEILHAIVESSVISSVKLLLHDQIMINENCPNTTFLSS